MAFTILSGTSGLSLSAVFWSGGLSTAQGDNFVEFFFGHRLDGQTHALSDQQHVFQLGVGLDIVQGDGVGQRLQFWEAFSFNVERLFGGNRISSTSLC